MEGAGSHRTRDPLASGSWEPWEINVCGFLSQRPEGTEAPAGPAHAHGLGNTRRQRTALPPQVPELRAFSQGGLDAILAVGVGASRRWPAHGAPGRAAGHRAAGPAHSEGAAPSPGPRRKTGCSPPGPPPALQDSGQQRPPRRAPCPPL